MSTRRRTKDARITFRVEKRMKRVVERAAAIEGLSLTEFAVLTLYREASGIVRGDQAPVLSDRDRDAFLSALDRPPEPAARLLRAAAAYKAAKARGQLR